jgi:hypothetical protein
MQLLADATGQMVAPPTLELRTGQTGLSGISMVGSYATVAQTVNEIVAGHADLGSPLTGDFFNWRITLPVVDPGTAAAPTESLLRTALIFRICVWITLAHPRWRFANVAEIIDRSELARHAAASGWDAAADALLVRLPLQATLRGGRRERIRARLTGNAAGGLDLLEVSLAADLRHDIADVP